MKKKWIIFIILLLVLAAVAAAAVLFFRKGKGDQGAPGEVLQAYMDKILEKDYQGMYGLLDEESRNLWSLEEFTERNQKIYEGIGLSGMEITFSEQGEDEARVDYKTVMETEAGSIQFQNYARFSREEEGWRLQWNDGLIFPDLTASDTVRVEETAASRGSIYDRNGGLLAGSGAVSSVGLVPGKYQEENGERLAALLEITAEDIQAALEQSWVTEDTFVPLKKIRLGEDNESLEQQLLEIPGVMITEDEDRVYPLGEKAGLLVGYIQEVTAEDMEKHPDAGYVTGSRIGRAGLEALYEDRLRGTSGCRIYIEDENGEEKEILAEQPVQNGEDITVTIDGQLQSALYDAFAGDKSCHVAMNPETGEVLALVSTPSYDSNDFALGMSNAQWENLNSDPGQPMYSRFLGTYAPGSSIKPVVAAIGLADGKLEAGADLGNSHGSWQKDESWGTYTVNSAHDYSGPANLENALIYSDNTYFAKAALQIGGDSLAEGLDKAGFGQEIPFALGGAASQYVNEGEDLAEDEIRLADTGYGQGEMLVNPLHLASIYSAFSNGGDMILPVLEYQEGSAPQYWLQDVFPEQAVDTVREDLIQVIENPEGTGAAARVEGAALAGKTGTAEIKDSQSDTEGTELGWFNVFTTDLPEDRAFLLVSMVEDVKDRGGSGYVIDRSRDLLSSYLADSAF